MKRGDKITVNFWDGAEFVVQDIWSDTNEVLTEGGMIVHLSDIVTVNGEEVIG